MSKLTAKKVCIRRFGLNPVEGYVSPHGYLHKQGIEMLTPTADSMLIPYDQVRAVYFVREFGSNPEEYQRREFATRPKLGGLWVRMKFHDGEELEGVMPNDLTIIGHYGVTLIPPDSKGNTHRVFVPSRAMDSFQVMGVIGKPKVKRAPRKPAVDPGQMGLFGEK